MGAEALTATKGEGPKEQKSNLHLCSHAFIDDFSPVVPLNNVTLRQFSGGNNISASRKNGKEFVFKFRGQTILMVNGVWCPVEPFIGSDRRRHAGLTFNVKFVDHPAGQNELQKDRAFKENIKTYFREFWFVARLFWLMPRPRPKSDRTEPMCANSAALVDKLMRSSDILEVEVPGAVVDAYIQEELVGYQLAVAKPSSANDIDTEFLKHLQGIEQYKVAQLEDAQKALRTKLFYVAGHSVPKFNDRKKTSKHVYKIGPVIQTLRSQQAE